MIKDRVVVIYADTLEELQVNGMGWHHDHCWHYYAGLSEDVPEHLQEFIAEDKKYVFLCEEDIPNKPNVNMENIKDEIYVFKVRDYTTELVGRKNIEGDFYYIQRGDGFTYRYDSYRIVFSCKLNYNKPN